MTQLRGIVRSKLWNLSQSPDEEVERSETIAETALEKQPEPSADIEIKDQFDYAMEQLALHPKIQGKEDHELVLVAFASGAIEPTEIAKETGLTKDRIYQVQRELRDIYPEIARKLEK